MFKHSINIMLLLCCIILNPTTSEGRSKFLIDETVYLKVNIHYQVHKRDNETSDVSWIGPVEDHKILPVNTPVKIKKWGRYFKILSVKDGTEIKFELNRIRMKVKREEYIKKITSPTKISFDEFSDIDRRGIKEGKVYTGMTKDGVFSALGYPPILRTPSLKSNTWVYWEDRVRTIAVTFDQNGIVARLRR